MAIAKKTLTKIATLLKIKEEDITAAIAAADEQDLEIPEVQTFTKDELATRDSATGNKKYNEGKQAGVEIFIKDQKQALGLEVEGKDGTAFLEAYKAKVIADAKITPAEHEKTIEKLRTSVKTAEDKSVQLESQLKNRDLTDKVKRDMPKNGLGLTKTDSLALLERHGYTFEDGDKGIVIKLNGQVLQDEKLQTPLAAKDAFAAIYKDKNWLEKDGEQGGKQGRGGKSSESSTGKPGKLSEAEKAWTDQGKSTMGSEFGAYINGLAKENAAFDMNG